MLWIRRHGPNCVRAPTLTLADFQNDVLVVLTRGDKLHLVTGLDVLQQSRVDAIHQRHGGKLKFANSTMLYRDFAGGGINSPYFSGGLSLLGHSHGNKGGGSGS